MKALLAMPAGLQHRVFDHARLAALRELVEIDTERTVPHLAEASDDELSEVEVLITGWGSGPVDAAALARLPRLRAILHTAGTVRGIVTDAVWERGDLLVTSATEVNAIPVAEYALAQILLAGKRSLAQEHRHRTARGARPSAAPTPAPARTPAPAVGNHGAVVGLIGASRIGVLVAEHLRRFDLEVLITDPFASAERIAALGATKVGPEELYARSDVVSLHAPDVPSTRGMVSRELLALMRDGTTFLNTARPALVDLDALRDEVVSGRLAAVLDVHDDLSPDDPLWDAPLATITPHIAGSQGNELLRMGGAVLEELRRLTAGEPPRFPVDPSVRDVSA